MKKELLKVSVIYIFIEILFFGRNFLNEYIAGDFLRFWVPNYHFILTSIKSGILPLWQPYAFLGVPGIFHPGHTFFYPLLWIFFLINFIFNLTLKFNFLGKTLELYQYLHLLIGAISMYYLLRKKLNLSIFASFFSGFIYVFSLLTITELGALQPLQGKMYLPLIIYFLIDFLQNSTFKNYFFLVLINVFLLSFGYPYYIVYFFYAELGLAVFYGVKSIFKTGIVLANAILLAGFFLLPQLHILTQAARFNEGDINPNFHTAFSPIGTHIISMLIPQGIYPDASLFWGTIPFIFLILGLFSLKKTKFNLWLVSIFLISLPLSLGGYLNIQKTLGGFPFFFDKFRTHGQIGILIFFSGTIFIAFGIEKILKGLKNNKIYLALWGFYLSILLLMLFLPFFRRNYLVDQKDFLVALGRMTIFFGAGLVICHLASLQKNKTLIIIALLLTFLEFYFYYTKIAYLKGGTTYQKYFEKNSLIPEIPNKDNLFRYMFSNNQFAYNTSYMKVFQYLGYDSTPYVGPYSLARFGNPKSFEIANVKYGIGIVLDEKKPGIKLIKTINPVEH
ncbi:MAG: hypothetical protein ACD_26C00016G0001, partial [uncultured bacterium]